RRRGCARVLLQVGDLDDRVLRGLAKVLDVYVAAALLELGQRRADRLVQGAAPAFCRLHFGSPLAEWLGVSGVLEVAGGGGICSIRDWTSGVIAASSGKIRYAMVGMGRPLNSRWWLGFSFRFGMNRKCAITLLLRAKPVNT